MRGLTLAVLLCTTPCGAADQLPFTFERALVVGQIGRPARSPIRFDAIEHQIVMGTFAAPTDGTDVTAPDGTVQKWAPLQAAASGDSATFSNAALGAGYAFATFDSETERTLMLASRGNSMVYVNGEPHVGDPYGYGWLRVPVRVRAGRNEFLFACSRGELSATLAPCASDGPHFLGADDTLPDLVAGATGELPIGVVIVQPADSPLKGATLQVRAPNGTTTTTPIPDVPARSAFKASGMVRYDAPATGSVRFDVTLELGGRVIAQRSLELHVVGPHDHRMVTRLSPIDGSVQYYAVVPAAGDGPAGIILSLHGASVEARGQAASYAPKSWAHIICPTNRRPFGFDWEDWGRLDALEALADAQARFGADPRRQWLTGHSMGGHGTWQLGAHFPDRFAAIAPSAGWISFASYGGVALGTAGAEGMFARATGASDTLAMRRNYAREGVYILHGDVDDNVPVEQARTMRAVLADGDGAFHADFAYHEQKGANHWWGNECVDWPPLMAFLEARSLPDPATVDQIDFTTAAPTVSSACDWLALDQQAEPWKPSTISVALDRTRRTIVGTTGNVARLALRPPIEGGPLAVTLDNTTVETTYAGSSPLWLVRSDATWKVEPAPSPATKSARRGGSLKDAFRNDMLIVYGTAGDDASDAALLAKARFDAETFWYRGNGSIDVIPDTDFAPGRFRDRGVILIGNAETNAAWNSLLGTCPVLVRNGSIKVGDRECAGEDLACAFTYPRPDSDVACVAVIAGSGPIGTRLTMRLPYFVSGVEYPDLCILHASTLVSGASAIRLAGFFGNDWSVERGSWADSTSP